MRISVVTTACAQSLATADSMEDCAGNNGCDAMGLKVRSDSILPKDGRLSELENSAVLDITGQAAELAISGSAEKKDGPVISRTARFGKFSEAARLFGLALPFSGLEEAGAAARASIGTQPAPRGHNSSPFLVSKPKALASAGVIAAGSAASSSG